jgi:predicted lipoprotein with Yx(FWY)xxD motif
MRIHVRSVVLTAVAAAVLAGSGWGASSAFGASQHPVKAKAVVFNTKHVAGVKGVVLVEGPNQVVYTFTGDKPGKAGTCKGGCAAIWPPVRGVPVLVRGAKIPGKFGTVNGQVTYNGLPLYLFTGAKALTDHANSAFKIVVPKSAKTPAPTVTATPTSPGW